MSKAKKLGLEDIGEIVPKDCTIIIVGSDGSKKNYQLTRFNLLAQIWIAREWGSFDAWNEIWIGKSEADRKSGGALRIELICKTIHYLIDDKSAFATWEDLARACGLEVGQLMNLQRALMVCMGASQPLVDETVRRQEEEIKKKVKESVTKAIGELSP